MSLPLRVVDAFSSVPFAGNPAAVCLLTAPAPDGWMRHVAREMNLSETAFLVPEGDGHRLRWFTPAVEVDLCGHATLASAHVLWEDGHLLRDLPAVFHTRSGALTARHTGEAIEMDFPAVPVTPCPPPAGFAEALGVEPWFVGRNGMDLLAAVETEEEVRRLTPDLARLAALPVRGLIVTARASSAGADFVSRFFAPACGVPEDPVTGSAHCALGPFWRDRLGRDRLLGEQVSARGGRVGVRVPGDRVILTGQAVTVLRGDLLPPP